MDYDQKILEFLLQSENINLLFELESLIPKVRTYLRKSLNNEFYEYIKKVNFWDGYANRKKDRNIYFYESKYEDPKYYHLGICIRLDADEVFYGILGSSNIDQSNEHFKNLKALLLTNGMRGSWHDWFTWKGFNSPDLNTVYQELIDKKITTRFEYWWDEFSEFADKVRDTLEKLNMCIASQPFKNM